MIPTCFRYWTVIRGYIGLVVDETYVQNKNYWIVSLNSVFVNVWCGNWNTRWTKVYWYRQIKMPHCKCMYECDSWSINIQFIGIFREKPLYLWVSALPIAANFATNNWIFPLFHMQLATFTLIEVVYYESSDHGRDLYMSCYINCE